MIPFSASAKFYDLLYQDKETAAEVTFVLDRLAGARTVLDLGCGTGRHAMELQRRSIAVVGIDRSPEMVAIARGRGVDGRVDDIAALQLNLAFDAVIALFHVAAYLPLGTLAATARAHLRPGGRLLFDTWHTAAVAKHPPEIREKTVDGVHRRATPVVDGHAIDVRYDYTANGETFTEIHRVVPSSPDELTAALEGNGFRVLEIGAFGAGPPATDDAFGIYALGEAI